MDKSDFFCRMYIVEDEIIELDCWSQELDPMTCDRLSNAEWGKSHLQEYQPEDLRELLGIPKTGNFQVIFTGTMEANGGMLDEYDEWVTARDVVFEEIPDKYLQYLLEPNNSLILDTDTVENESDTIEGK